MLMKIYTLSCKRVLVSERFIWDSYSDQPHIIRDRSFRKSVRKKHLKSYARMVLKSLFILPFATLVMKLFKGKQKLTNREMMGLCVNLDKGARQVDLVEELGVQNLLMRVFLDQNIDEFVEFAKLFRGKSIVINIIQDRKFIENEELLRDKLDEIFSKFDQTSSEFVIGNAINRLKWGFFSVDEYIEFYKIAKRLRDASYPHIKLIAPSVIDFEYYYNADVMFGSGDITFDKTSALLYVDRRGSPKNSQYGIFDLKNKIDLLYALVRLSPKTKSDEIYITEVNWPISNTAPYAPTSEKECVSLEEYTLYMQEYMDVARKSGKVSRVFWHQLVATGYGLVDGRDGTRYPQFYKFKELLND